MIKLTPPMGWNSWNTFGRSISEDVITETVDAIISQGLDKLGYEYVVIDDCWSKKVREGGKLIPDPVKFPNGIKQVSDYVHSKGLKFGMYSCVGMTTCDGYPASFEHEFSDAAQFAEWGVDFLKMDYCNRPHTIPGDILYKRVGTALANCGRDILFSACSWGVDETRDWVKTSGANMWRSTNDIVDTWESVKNLSLKAKDNIKYQAINHFMDMDMLVVGMNAKGNVGYSGCTDIEYRTHFSLWALLGSPLMIGCDVRSMDKTTIETLTNKEVIAINQDPACNQPYEVGSILGWHSGEAPIYVKHLEGGDIAVGMFNLTDEEVNFCLPLERLALPESTGKTLFFRELWTGETLEAANTMVQSVTEPHACKLFRASLRDL